MIGRILKDFRYANKISQRDLAKTLGVVCSTICRIESGKSMDQKTMLKLINVLFSDRKIVFDKRRKLNN